MKPCLLFSLFTADVDSLDAMFMGALGLGHLSLFVKYNHVVMALVNGAVKFLGATAAENVVGVEGM